MNILTCNFAIEVLEWIQYFSIKFSCESVFDLCTELEKDEIISPSYRYMVKFMLNEAKLTDSSSDGWCGLVSLTPNIFIVCLVM